MFMRVLYVDCHVDVDVAVDVRPGSATYGKWVKAELSAENGVQIFVPRGFLHGFVTCVPDTEIAAASMMAAHQISKQSGAEAELTPQDFPTAAAVPVAALYIDVETSDAPQASVTTSLSAGNIVTEVPAGVASGVPGAMQEQTAGGDCRELGEPAQKGAASGSQGQACGAG